MISHRGLSVITPLPFGGGEKGGAAISHVLTLFFFSQTYTEEQNTQRRTETLSQPIAQSITTNDGCNVLWYIAVKSVISVVCLQAFVGSPCSQKGFCSSVKICEREKFQRAPCVLFSQNYTEEQNTQGFTETLSQPIAQSITAKDGCWVFNVGCWWLAIGVSRWSRPSLRGRGRGEGPVLLCLLSLFAERLLFICENLWERKHPTNLLRSKHCERENHS